jgi:Ribbon-helix-helix protein, copG family
MLTRRLQILLDEAQYARLEAYAREQGLSVGAAVRAAIDRTIPSDAARRQAAARAILAAEPMQVGSVEELKRELDEMHGRHLT